MRAHSVAVRVGSDAPVLSCSVHLSCSVTHLVRRPDCLSGERDSISLRSASFSTGCSSARPELLPWKQEAVGSNPTALTILHLRLRKVVRSGAQPVSKAGPTSGSRVRLLHLPPAQAAVIRYRCGRVGWALASPRRCKRPASAVVVQFHPYPPAPRRLQDGQARQRPPIDLNP